MRTVRVHGVAVGTADLLYHGNGVLDEFEQEEIAIDNSIVECDEEDRTRIRKRRRSVNWIAGVVKRWK